MTQSATPANCARARAGLLAGTDQAGHVAACAACAAFAHRLTEIDGALQQAGETAAHTVLPEALSQRILEAARQASVTAGGRSPVLSLQRSEPRRTRTLWLEGGLRLGAVAAVLWMVLMALPETGWAGEVDFTGLESIGGRWRDAVSSAISSPAEISLAPFGEHIKGDVEWPSIAHSGWLAGAAIGLLATGFGLLRSGGGR